jgi:hypothetical protein
MPTTGTGTTTTDSGFAPPAVPTREHYGAFMESWRTREIVEAQFHFARFREAVESRHAHDETLVALAAQVDRLLARRAVEGPELDDELVASLVQLKREIDEHL